MARLLTFNIVMAYENLAAAIRAQDVFGRLAAGLNPELEFSNDVWKFDSLAETDLRESAAVTAAAADLIVISTTSAAEPPEHVKNWIGSWLPHKPGASAALVAMVDPQTGPAQHPSPLCDYLQRVARKGGMDFFCNERSWAPPVLEDPPAFLPQVRQGNEEMFAGNETSHDDFARQESALND